MFQVVVIKPNTSSEFKQTLWTEIEKVKEFVTLTPSNNLQSTLNTVFNPEYKKEKLDLNTVDVLYTRNHTYQLVYSNDSNDENYIGSVINYKRKPMKGVCVVIKIKLTENKELNKIEYKEDTMTIEDDVVFVIKDLFYHKGFKISSEVTQIEYDNKYKSLDSSFDTSLNSHIVNLFGIPFKIWFNEKEKEPGCKLLSYVNDIGLFLNKKISEAYITCAIYPQCKCLSLDMILVKQFIELISYYPDEGELKEITIAYSFANKNNRTENAYITFDDFYWKVMRDTK